MESRDHAPGDRFPVEQRMITTGRLDRMAERVAEIENHAHAKFPFILAYYIGLNPDGGGDHFLERCRIALVDGFAVTFNEAEKRRIADEPSFDAFINSGAQFPLGKGAQ